jgi:hypothetical protein
MNKYVLWAALVFIGFWHGYFYGYYKGTNMVKDKAKTLLTEKFKKWMDLR